MPPSVIAGTWSPAELRQAEALARLEGWGQEKRRTALLAAEMHNSVRLYAWAKSIDPKQPSPSPPKLLTESDFLPRRAKRNAAAKSAKPEPQKKQEKAMQNLSSIMNSLCGYRS